MGILIGLLILGFIILCPDVIFKAVLKMLGTGLVIGGIWLGFAIAGGI